MVCGCEVVVLVAIPAAVSLWPTVVAAATAAAAVLGFTTAQVAGQVVQDLHALNAQAEDVATEVSLSVTQGEEVTQGLASGQEVCYAKEGGRNYLLSQYAWPSWGVCQGHG